jgi:hypothetical protein
MTTDPSSYDGLTRERRDTDSYRDGYAEAKRAFLIGWRHPDHSVAGANRRSARR